MSKITEIFFFLSVFLLFGIGIFLVMGTLKGVKVLVAPPVEWYSIYPYWFLKKMGNRAIQYFHIFIGIIFILGSMYIFLKGISLMKK